MSSIILKKYLDKGMSLENISLEYNQNLMYLNKLKMRLDLKK